MTDQQTSGDRSTSAERYPPPPWRLGGQHWGALFKTDRPVVAAEAESWGGSKMFSRRLGIGLLRYTTGTLVYDELIVSVPIRIGLKPYLWVRDIWVSDAQSRAGGIHIWNLPKQMATFTWQDDGVKVQDDAGLVAELWVRPATTHWPWGISLVPIAGSNDGSLRTASAVWRGRVSLAKPVVRRWSDRFEERLLQGPAIGFSSPHFLMKVRGPKPP